MVSGHINIDERGTIMDKYSEDTLNVLFKLKNRPVVYLGAKSITRLKIYTDGFSHGYNYPGIGTAFPEFQERMEEKYKEIECISWATILLRQTNDEAKAFDLFFEEFEEYLKENGVDIPER